MWRLVLVLRLMNQPLPSLPASVKCFEAGDKIVYINGDIPAWIVTDRIGQLVLSLFDGQRTAADIVDIVKFSEGDGGLDPEAALAFIDRVVESRLLETRPTPPVYQRGPMRNVHLSLSEGCNLQCRYCYARQRVETSDNALTIDDYRLIISRLAEEYGNITFTLTGGEPLLNPDWADVARAVKDAGCRAFLLTNGTLINESNIDDIAALFDLVTLSIDGSTTDIHARTRGDNLEKVLRAIYLLQSHEVDYTLSMTVTRANIDDVADMAALYGSRLSFAPLFPTGSQTDALSITGDEYYEALASATKVEPLSFSTEAIARAAFDPALKCSIGDGSLSISATGDIYPCQLLHTESLCVGNVRDGDIIDTIRASQIFVKLAAMTVDTIEGCRDCAFRYFCGGACRARAFYETGKIGIASPFCIYEQRAFLDALVRLSR